MSEALSLNHIVIYGEFLERSMAFYKVVLGEFGFVKKNENSFSGNHLTIEIRQASDMEEIRSAHGPGCDHIGFRAPDRDFVQQVMMTVEMAGYKGGRIIQFDDGRYSGFIPDPDGFRVEISYKPKD